MILVVDASVLVAAADPTDVFSGASRRFLGGLAERQTPIVLPAIAVLEVTCALARRLRDGDAAQRLAAGMLDPFAVRMMSVDAQLLAEAAAHGAALSLRAADALYVAAARRHDATLVAWDEELVARAGAVTPDTLSS